MESHKTQANVGGLGMGGYSSFSREGGNKEFLVFFRENKGILSARAQNFH